MSHPNCVRLVAAISHPVTRFALLLGGDEVDDIRFRLHFPNDLADLFLRQLGLGEADAVELALLDGGNFVQSAAAVDRTPGLRRLGRT